MYKKRKSYFFLLSLSFLDIDDGLFFTVKLLMNNHKIRLFIFRNVVV